MTTMTRTAFRPVLAAAVSAAAFAAALGLAPPPATEAAGRAPELQRQASKLVPHRAVYKMTLASTRAGAGVAGAQGVMLYRFAETCEAWTAETNVFLKLQYAEGPEASSTWSFAAVESKDGRDLHFRLKHVRDGETVEQLKGSARLPAPGVKEGAKEGTKEGAKEGARGGDGGAEGEATFVGAADGGKDRTMALPAGTLFPTRHLVKVIEAAAAGTKFLPETVFDGASLDNPYRITASIGAARPSAGPAGTKAALDAAGLETAPVWPVRLAFFPVASRKPQPEFEIGVDYRPDGIAERVLQDYGDFAIEMRPAEMEVLARPEC